MKSYWLVKSEPGVYAWGDLVRDGKTRWDGIRNFAARNHLRAMSKGDPVLYYHSGEERAVVGIAEVAKAHYADPTAKEGDWSCVDLAPVRGLAKPVTLAAIKSNKTLAKMVLIKQGRLSVSPVTKSEWDVIVKLGSAR